MARRHSLVNVRAILMQQFRPSLPLFVADEPIVSKQICVSNARHDCRRATSVRSTLYWKLSK